MVYLGVTGNHYFSDQMIRERLLIEPASVPRYPYGRFNESYLRQDVQAIQNLYSANGFRDVKVTSHSGRRFSKVVRITLAFLSKSWKDPSGLSVTLSWKALPRPIGKSSSN